jgi:hypothetical protein
MLRELEDFKETLKKELGGNIHPAVAGLQMRIGEREIHIYVHRYIMRE